MSARRRPGRLEHLVAWGLKNADVLAAVLVALVVAVLEIFGDSLPEDVTSGAILSVLCLLAVSHTVERVRQPAAVKEALAGTERALHDIAMIRSLHGGEVGQALEQARRETTRWQFKGGTGTYLRAVTLPELLRATRLRRFRLTVAVEIIDPREERVCAQYAHFRQTFARRDAEPWTTDRTRKEAYATVLAAYYYRSRFRQTLDIGVHLSAAVPTLRFDLSDRCLVITQDDDRRENFLVDQGKPLYLYYETELLESRRHATPVDLSPEVPLSEEPTVDEVRNLFEELGMPLPVTYTDPDVAEIAVKALNAPDPYGR
ncbi:MULTISPECIES: hypothetical protein [Streptomyces]|uniref:Uncharacterized protein n=1 Tax=Streptomyces chilikensis TaxID=1194079 RepID=A0ABV3ES66_9ACTN|nr:MULTISPECIES: hypothetical protein [Streptomyces]MDH6227024.1 hypothetical protein [Streptomyces sp. MJP52]